ncbi:MAG: hypothetical protein K2Q45_07185 [Nitrosomonas sp.]|nr:hypothetical protein [Nitrosomonas sp.]
MKPANNHGGSLNKSECGTYQTTLNGIRAWCFFDGGVRFGKYKYAVYPEVFFHINDKNNLHAIEKFSAILIVQRGSSLFKN